ncbi:MAG: hypothetical protein H0V43_09090 [Gemmatimonadales bacterium]|nr:hypothetical protein [Gemmatimonadales bacterium]
MHPVVEHPGGLLDVAEFAGHPRRDRGHAKVEDQSGEVGRGDGQQVALEHRLARRPEDNPNGRRHQIVAQVHHDSGAVQRARPTR